MHDNQYDSDSVHSGSVFANSKTTGEEDDPSRKEQVLPNELVVPSLAPRPTQTSKSIPSNDVPLPSKDFLEAVIA